MTFSVILTLQLITEPAALSMDIVGTLTLTVETGARADVMAEPVVQGAALERPLQLRPHLEPRNPC